MTNQSSGRRVNRIDNELERIEKFREGMMRHPESPAREHLNLDQVAHFVLPFGGERAALIVRGEKEVTR